MNRIISGKALKYGDNVNTDIISPPQFMELPIEEAAEYAMSAVDLDFHTKARTHSIFVAGENLGSGSSRETSPLTLKYLGIEAVVAVFFARIFYRNCINLGIPAIECAEADRIAEDDEIEIDIATGTISNVTKGEKYGCSRIPEHIFELIEGGGLVGYMKAIRDRKENEL
ncbi:MAG: 3-isopropylmalate dehydratase [Clostridiales Family XIII bacterium]|jgi:3-isopropylmalate/(R)-2-methylmalate dehydratase small subunit|nr:3-isopropylmalate dehydratase [Clostridiales Family XIII bacterium]